MTHANAYITQDYARAIQEEGKVLIKAMKAREEHGLNDAKVKGRFLFINNERYDSKVFPSILSNLKSNIIYWQAYLFFSPLKQCLLSMQIFLSQKKFKSIDISNVRTQIFEWE